MNPIEKLKTYQSLEPKYQVKQETKYPIYEFDLSGTVDRKRVLDLITNTPVNFDRTNMGLNIMINPGKDIETGGYESNYFLHKTSNDWDFLIKEMIDKVVLIENKLRRNAHPIIESPKVFNLWYLWYNKNSGQVKHEHGWFVKWVALYYVQVEDDASPLIITNIDAENKQLEIMPKEGHLILFPGMCEHQVKLQQGLSKRIAVAANIGF